MGTAMRELRTAVMIRVEVSWPSPAGSWQSNPARMEDRSARGACIRMKTPLAIGAKLRVQWRFEQFSGICKYCRRDGNEYLVGIQRDSIPPGAFQDNIIKNEGVESNAVPLDGDHSAQAKDSDLAGVAAKLQGIQGRDTNSGISPANFSVEERDSISHFAKPAAIPSPRLTLTSVATPLPKRTAAPGIAARDIVPEKVADNSEDWDHNRIARHRAFTARRLPAQAVRQETSKPKEVRRERKFMGRKWLERAPWNNKHDAPGVGAESAAAKNQSGKENHEMSEPSPAFKLSPELGAKSSSFQVDLLPMEEVYRAAGVVPPAKGYSVHKVVDMLHSEHIKGLSPELKRAAVLMALDAAGVSLEQIQQDAKSRQEALDHYEAEQNKQAEAEWARRAEENAQIQAELERVKSHYMARINRNLEGVAREKATFDEWLSRKKLESESMMEALSLCAKASSAKPAAAPPLALSAAANGGAKTS